MKTYCIFQVYDYKGGELSSKVNLSFDRFISYLSEKFENIELDDIATRRDKSVSIILDEQEHKSLFDEVKSKVMDIMNDDDFFSTYAGGHGFCGELYEVEDGRLREVSFKKYIDDITNYIINNWIK